MIIPRSNYEKSTVGTEENYFGKLQRAWLKKGQQNEKHGFTQ